MGIPVPDLQEVSFRLSFSRQKQDFRPFRNSGEDFVCRIQKQFSCIADCGLLFQGESVFGNVFFLFQFLQEFPRIPSGDKSRMRNLLVR